MKPSGPGFLSFSLVGAHCRCYGVNATWGGWGGQTQHPSPDDGGQRCPLGRIARKPDCDSLEPVNHSFIGGPLLTQTDVGPVAKQPATWANNMKRVGKERSLGDSGR